MYEYTGRSDSSKRLRSTGSDNIKRHKHIFFSGCTELMIEFKNTCGLDDVENSYANSLRELELGWIRNFAPRIHFVFREVFILFREIPRQSFAKFRRIKMKTVSKIVRN